MVNINYSFDRKIESAYIITLKDNPTSERLAQRCKDSCDSLGMPNKFWHGFNGTGSQIITPDHLKSASHMSWFKVIDSELSTSEVACALSHISLWCHCIEIDKPIIVFEHDALMVKKIEEHPLFNSIIYLGCEEQYNNQYQLYMTPIHGTIARNYNFIWRAHAYVIDPQVAKNMVSYVLKQGIFESLDIMMRADQFTIIQLGFFAYDSPERHNTTITSRKQTQSGFKKS